MAANLSDPSMAPSMPTPSEEIENIARTLKIAYMNNQLTNFHELGLSPEKCASIRCDINILEQIGLAPANKIQNAFKDLNKQIYHQLWKKLPNFHKIIKIKEYVKEKYSANTQLEELLITKLENKELPDKLIIYDTSLGHISDIPNIILAPDNPESPVYKFQEVIIKKRKPKNT